MTHARTSRETLDSGRHTVSGVDAPVRASRRALAARDAALVFAALMILVMVAT
jgi:hypothetical protein